MGGAGGSGGAGGEGGSGGQSCDPLQSATDIDAAGNLTCAPLDAEASLALRSGCGVISGWRNVCDAGCTTGPDKWGAVTTDACDPNGSNVTCDVEDLGGTQVRLLGVEMDFSVDGNDRFYAGFGCLAGNSDVSGCGASARVTGYAGGVATCTNVEGAIRDYVRDHCRVVSGWRDGCNGCTDPPSKWGTAGNGVCTQGAGNTCGIHDLDGTQFYLTSFDADGDVNGDDTFYWGLRCDDAAESTTLAVDTCPAGRFVTGIAPSGELECSLLDEAVLTYVRGKCALYAGWLDGCGGCTDTPAKWGFARDGQCDVGVGTDNVCVTMMVDNQVVNLFGLNADGNVDDNDKFHVGFTCQ